MILLQIHGQACGPSGLAQWITSVWGIRAQLIGSMRERSGNFLGRFMEWIKKCFENDWEFFWYYWEDRGNHWLEIHWKCQGSNEGAGTYGMWGRPLDATRKEIGVATSIALWTLWWTTKDNGMEVDTLIRRRRIVRVRIIPMDTFDTLRPQMLDTVGIFSVKDRSPDLGLLGTVVIVLLLATIQVLEWIHDDEATILIPLIQTRKYFYIFVTQLIYATFFSFIMSTFSLSHYMSPVHYDSNMCYMKTMQYVNSIPLHALLISCLLNVQLR